MGDDEQGSWDQYQKLVLAELKRLNAWCSSIDKKQDKFSNQLIETKTELKIKAGVWGAMGAAIPAVGALIIWFMSR